MAATEIAPTNEDGGQNTSAEVPPPGRGKRISRRLFLAGSGAAAAAGLSFAGVGTVLLTDDLISRYFRNERDAVPGFRWDDKKFPPFRNEELHRDAPLFRGDESFINRLRHPVDSYTVAVIGALAADIHKVFEENPNSRLGVVDAQPKGMWRQGMAEPGQLFGGIVDHEGKTYVAAALGIGPGDVQFSWAVRRGVQTEPIRTIEIATLARASLARVYPHIPEL